MQSIRTDTLADATERFEGPVYVTAVQALVRALLLQRARDEASGLRTAGYVTGYRGSPLGGVDLALTRAKGPLAKAGIRFHPGLNEELAATAIWGTQQVGLFEKAKVDGVFGVWYGKGPGVDRAGDALKHGNLAGASASGGVVVLAGDDHMSKSSTTAHQSEPALIAAGMPVLNPAGIEEIVPYFLLAVAMSRFSGCWVSLKCLTDVMDSSAALSPEPVSLTLPARLQLPDGGVNIRRSDGPVQQEARLTDWKLPAAQAFASANGIDRVTLSPARKRFGIVTCGKSWLDVQTALGLLGLDAERCIELGIGVYKVGMTWPLETGGARAFADGFEEVIVVEEKRAIVEDQLRSACYAMLADRRPVISGKSDPSGRTQLPAHGELDPLTIARVLQDRLSARGLIAEAPALAVQPSHPAEPNLEKRGPWFCAGCPHNISTRLPAGSLAGAGIGCHGLAAFNDTDTTLPFTQMGGEGANWIGRAPFVDGTHIFQNLGDGTYNHSGLLAIRAAVGAGVNITYKILFNDAVAMTGGQPHDGALSVEAIARQLDAEGVRRVTIVAEQPERHQGTAFPTGSSVHHRDELDAVQTALRDVPGVTALIFDQACATERRRRRKRGIEPKPDVAVYINDLACEGCGDCGAVSNCVAIQPLETPLGRKRRIDPTACNVDQSCLKGFCPSFVTVEGVADKPAPKRPAPPAAPELPEPVFAAPTQSPYGVLITGVGGTGVVTVSALLGMAAHLDGLRCRVLDQTGMAQKNGAVTSHVQFAAAGPDVVLPSRLPPESADLVLGCDLLGAATSEALNLTRPGRSAAVVNESVTTTGRFTRDRDLDLGLGRNRNRLETHLGDEAVTYIEASALATELFGDATTANMVLLGTAWQRGLLPLSIAAIDRAIELNAVAVAANRLAFAWGRAAALGLHPASSAARSEAPQMLTTSQLIADMSARLVRYHNEAYARRYRDFVTKVSDAECRALGGANSLTRAVAEALYKLMAYKDEYEVARLLTDATQLERIVALHGPGKKLFFHLAPPLLARTDPRTGHPRKIKVGAWILPVFRALSRAKILRGTPLDLFGYTGERRTERKAIDDYMTTIDTILPRLSAQTRDTILEIARLPMSIRGYGHVKGAARLAVEQSKQALMQRLAGMEK